MMYFNSFADFRMCISADIYRYAGDYGKPSVRKVCNMYLRHPEMRYIVWMRIAQFCIGRPALQLLKIWSLLRLQILRNKTGIQISIKTKIGKGFFIGHFGSVVINPATVIGDNVNIIQTCTIGVSYRGEGAPTIGNKVYVGAGSRIFGGVEIGDNAAIGVNSVVTHDVPSGAVVVGAPAQVISMKGSEGYVFNTVNPDGTYNSRFK